MKVFVDLFSGLGGASAAFDDDPAWVTIKIDNNPELLEHNRGLILADISDVHATVAIIKAVMPAYHDKLVVWASPPCNQFSYANANRDPDNFDLTLLDAAQDIVKILDPDYWLIENVQGAVPVFSEEISRAPTQVIGSVYLWGHFPLIPIAERDAFVHKKSLAKGSRTLRPNYKALIPFQISKGLRDAIDYQRLLTSFF